MNDFHFTENHLAEFRRFKAKHAEDEAIAADFGGKPRPIHGVEPFPCDAPNILRVKDAKGFTMTLLYPSPRPVPKDPQFQHAADLDRWPRVMTAWAAYGREEFWRDWQWLAVLMDAQDRMPAGACQSFDYGDDTYGAQQMTWEREA